MNAMLNLASRHQGARSFHIPDSLTAEELNQLVGQIYDGSLEEVPWKRALTSIHQRLEAKHVTLIIRPTTPEDNGLHVDIGGAAQESVNAYYSQYYMMDPFLGGSTEHMLAIDDIMDRPSWEGSPYYQQFLRHMDIYHLMSAEMQLPDGESCRLVITRSHAAAPFSADDKAFCNTLLPHLRRALFMRSRVGCSNIIGKLYSGAVDSLMIATIIIDEHGKVMQCNQVADELLESRSGLRLLKGRLEAEFGPENRQLQKLIKEAIAKSTSRDPHMAEAMSIMQSTGGEALGAVIQSIPISEWSEGGVRPAVALFLRNPERSARAPQDVIRQLYGLTPSETALAAQLVDGFTLEETAENLGIKRNTARAHLRSIFSKTGVTRQTELVRLLLNSVAALSSVTNH
ncbi:helix-turn-helix transcriptional regulator [Halomonas sp. H5]|uniref:helix-turn-helix transcriptional regulator n=1 Tax=Halomonas sp. H5 TaxID=3423910 RepID=UPI003D360826